MVGLMPKLEQFCSSAFHIVGVHHQVVVHDSLTIMSQSGDMGKREGRDRPGSHRAVVVTIWLSDTALLRGGLW